MATTINAWEGQLTRLSPPRWVRLSSASTQNFVSQTPSDPQNGSFVILSVPSGVTYTLSTGPTQNGPWTAEDTSYSVGFFASNPASTMANGLVGTPGLSFSNDSTTGLYSSGAGKAGMSVSGSEVERWAAAGVGVLRGAGGDPTVAMHVGAGAALSWAGLTLGYGTGTPQVIHAPTSGEAGIGAYVNDGTRNQRVKLFLDDTNGVWGLYQSYGTSTAKPFVISTVNTEYARLDFVDNSWQFNSSTRLRFGTDANAVELFDTAGTNGRRLRLAPKTQASSTASAQLELVPGASVDPVGQIPSQVLLYNVPGANYERGEISWTSNQLTFASTQTGSGTLRGILFNMGATNAFYIDTGGNARSYQVHDFGYALNNTIRIAGANNGVAPVISARGVSDAAVNIGLAPKGTGVVDFQYAVVALGGGAAPTLGTIGGSGPATAAQNSWLKVNVNGTASYIAIWR